MRAGMLGGLLAGSVLLLMGCAAAPPSPAPGLAAVPTVPEQPRAASLLDDSQAMPDADPATLEAQAAEVQARHGADAVQLIRPLQRLGNALYARNQRQTAAEVWRRVLVLLERHAGPDSLDVASALMNIGALLGQTDRAEAAAVLERSLAIRTRALGREHAAVAYTLTNLGNAYLALGRHAEARQVLEEALVMRERLLGPDHYFVSWTAQYLSAVYRAVGDLPRALALAERSLAIRERQADTLHGTRDVLVAAAMTSVADTLRQLGDADGARARYEQAATLARRLLRDATPTRAGILARQARLLVQLGDYAAADAALAEGMELARAVPARSGALVSEQRAARAEWFLAIGEPAAAEREAHEALQVDAAALPPLHPLRLARLGLHARAAAAAGNAPLALRRADEALALARALRDAEATTLADTLQQQAAVERRLGSLARAEDALDAADATLQRALGAAHPARAALLLERAEQALALHEPARAAAAAAEGRALATRLPGSELAWQQLQAIARAEAARGRSSAAIFWGKQAVNRVQALRGDLAALPSQQQGSFVAARRSTYVSLAEALTLEGRLAEAQQALSLLKEEELHTLVQRDAADDPRQGRMAYVEGPERAAAATVERLEAALAAAAGALTRAEIDRALHVGTAGDPVRSSGVELAYQGALQRWNDGVASWLRFIAEPGLPAALPANASAAAMPDAGLTRALAAAGQGAASVQYLLAPRQLVILLTTARGTRWIPVPVDSVTVTRAVLELREAMVRRGPYREPARRLHGWLIAPIEAVLRRERIQRLWLSPDGVLRYLPMAALHDGRRHLVERYELTLRSSAGGARAADAGANAAVARGQPLQMTGFGVTRGVAGFAPLPGVREEFDALRAVPVPGDVLLDGDFTADGLARGLRARRPLVHVASHFRFEPGAAADSYLLLGDGQRLTLRRMKRERLDFGGTELLALSACETALAASGEGAGRDGATPGAEVEGFAALAQRQGARAVLATLWRVADRGSAPFMRALYAARLHRGTRVAQALRIAQRAALASADARRHPYHWAGYALNGPLE